MSTSDFASRLTSHPRPLVLDVWAPWCAPCRWMAPIVERLQAEYEGRVEVWKVNADEQPEAARRLDIVGIPTLVAFRGGREIMRKVGASSEAALRAVFEAALTGEKPSRGSISLTDRALRLAAGTAVVILALGTGPSIVLLAVGGLLLFAGVADRCPIWQAIRARITSLLGRSSARAR